MHLAFKVSGNTGAAPRNDKEASLSQSLRARGHVRRANKRGDATPRELSDTHLGVQLGELMHTSATRQQVLDRGLLDEGLACEPGDDDQLAAHPVNVLGHRLERLK
ncbi:hypothetical protein ACE2AJ_14600 [Aquihabitans daechungensis]|uniref:hypothetical protein n=1 Tax=Aquihabitans daechungensis TaxID=1052257 RepID=UPI003BA0370D